MGEGVKLIDDVGVRVVEISSSGDTVCLMIDSDGDLSICHVDANERKTDFSVSVGPLLDAALDWLGLERKAQ